MKTKYRSVWISDIHLGTRESKVQYLDDFMHSIECEYLYLVGDIIDFWVMNRGSTYFPQSHVNILRRFLNKARQGTKVKYVIGNHDEVFRKYMDYLINVDFGNIEIADNFTHTTADGRKLWVTHGDLYDSVTRYHKWVARFGDLVYQSLLVCNRHFNRFRNWIGKPYWSLSGYLKHKAKTAVEFINSFEDALAHECKEQGFDGVVCGHIHHAEIKDIGGVTYYNDGDWVESCTALVEHIDGRMELIKWHTMSHSNKKGL